jgi:hypothetical protein
MAIWQLLPLRVFFFTLIKKKTISSYSCCIDWIALTSGSSAVLAHPFLAPTR